MVMGIHNPRQQLFYHIWQLQANKLKSFQFSHKSTLEIITYTVVSLQKRELGYKCLHYIYRIAFTPARKLCQRRLKSIHY